jgi:hypothetical protein
LPAGKSGKPVGRTVAVTADAEQLADPVFREREVLCVGLVRSSVPRPDVAGFLVARFCCIRSLVGGYQPAYNSTIIIAVAAVFTALLLRTAPPQITRIDRLAPDSRGAYRHFRIHEIGEVRPNFVGQVLFAQAVN